MSPMTWTRAEKGQPVRVATWRAIEHALGLPTDAVVAAVNGHPGAADALADQLGLAQRDRGAIPAFDAAGQEARRTTEFARFNDQHSIEAVAFYLVDRLDRLRRSDPGNPRNTAILAVADAVARYLHWRPESADVSSLDETSAPETRPAVEDPPIRVRFKTADAPAAPATEDDRRAQGD